MIVKFLFSSFVAFLVYIMLVGSLGFDELVIGVAISLAVGYITKDLLVKNERKVLSPARWLYAALYILVYWFYFEVQAHLDVVKRIFTLKLKPGIVRVPYKLKSDFGVISVANSITNTPGTVVVDMDEKRRYYYVHWINVISPEEKVCYENISAGFEKYVRRFL